MNAYITVMSTDSYLLGVLVLYKSLIKQNAKYPLYVLISEDVSLQSQNKLTSIGINLIHINSNIKLSEDIKKRNNNAGYSNWNNTLQKLNIFDFVQFEKLVYLDSDMIITTNIDELFDKPHMSAVIAGKLMPMNREWKDLNSGLMVIKPQKEESIKILSTLSTVSNKKKYFGDQDLLQEYYDLWPNESKLHLDQKYNVFDANVDYYVSSCGYNCNFTNPDDKTISVVHFVGKNKPWMESKAGKVRKILSLIKNKKINSLKIYITYYKLLNNI